jgi:hypothetical protein
MTLRLAGCAVCLSLGAALGHVGHQQPTTLLGRWVGDSHCVGAHPACHEEHVLYRIDSAGRGRLTLRGSRIAGRDTVPMGDLSCAVTDLRLETVCRIPAGVWHFSVVHGRLEGVLTLADSTVMRRVVAHRAQPH